MINKENLEYNSDQGENQLEKLISDLISLEGSSKNFTAAEIEKLLTY